MNSQSPRPAAAPGIPLRAHLIWFGQQFPWVNVLAVRSAALRGGFDEVVLHHDSDLSRTPHYAEMVETERVRLSPLDVGATLERCGPYARGLADVYARLRTAVIRSDVVRYALLYAQGGVYLDIDTVTVRDFEPLCRAGGAFCGLERIVYPATVRHSRSPLVKAVTLGRAQLRGMLRSMPRGHLLFRRLERLYPLSANQAVFGSAARSPFISQMIERLFQTDPEQQPLPNVIGPHLIQAMVAEYRGDDFRLHPPEVFYPLGPVISQHWFRQRPHADLSTVLTEQTRLVHWYGTSDTKDLVAGIDPDYVRRNAETQLFSALARPFVA